MEERKRIDRRELLQEALGAIDELQKRLDAARYAASEPIAIVGIGCRYPGHIDGPESFWQLLANQRNAVTDIPDERWKLAGFEPPEGGKRFRAGLLDSIELFDPAFFGISAREAITMDPQQRLVLEVAWEALENAGYAPDSLDETATGVFVGITTGDYAEIVRAASVFEVYAATGGAHNVAAGRLAYLLGLQGPAMAVDTACSSSLVAIHLAVLSLRARTCDMAIAGGVNVALTPGNFVCFSNWGMMAPDGHCKTFDASADGFVRSEGCGVVVLKRLSEALAARDHIWAVVRGTAVNQDGRSGGLTVPNGRAQEAVVRRALADAQLDAKTISYLEAHGTGTVLGDPIEMHALAAVFRDRKSPLLVGSVKTNLGHPESAAGVAGLIKTVLGMDRGWIPAHLHFQKMSPHIRLDGAPLEVTAERRDWKRGAEPRRAGVSSFGFSGTNAHVIVEEAPELGARQREWERPLHVLCLSARSEKGLQELQERYAAHLSQRPELEAGDVCYTANAGRAEATHRRVWIGQDTEALRRGLEKAEAAVQGTAHTGQRVAFLFPGQGAQYHGMGRQLYETQPVFRSAVEECRELLRGLLDRDLVDLLWGEASVALKRTRYTQPAVFAVEWALSRLWASWGVEPAWVLGHSVGEYVAASVAGLWSMEDGLRLVAERGRLMEEHGGGGAMVAVDATVEEAAGWLAGEQDLSLAAENGPASIVISGERAAIGRLEQKLAGQGRRTVRLEVSEAFHSPLMAPVEGRLNEWAGRVRFREMEKGFVSSLTGQVARREELSAGRYWGRQAREAVQFRRAMETLAAQGCTAYVEVGPGTTLLGLGKQCVGGDAAMWAASLRRQRMDWSQMLESVAELWTRGVAVDWEGFDRPYQRRRLSLPTSPFERQRYWIDTRKTAPASSALHPLLTNHVRLAEPKGRQVFEGTLSLELQPFIADHVIQDKVIVPATAYLEMAGAAARILGIQAPLIEKIEYQQPMSLESGVARTVQVLFDCEPKPATAFRVFSRSQQANEDWTLHAIGQINASASGDATRVMNREAFERVRSVGREMTGEQFYHEFREVGNAWGAAFQALDRVWIDGSEAWAEVSIPLAIRDDIQYYLFHPALADACGHALAALLNFRAPGSAFMGSAIDGVRAYRSPTGDKLYAYARLHENAGGVREVMGDVDLFDQNGLIISELRGAHLWLLSSEQSDRTPRHWFYSVSWLAAQSGTLVEADTLLTDRFWFVLTDRSGVGQEVASKLREQKARTLMLTPGYTYRCLSADEIQIRAGSESDLQTVLAMAPRDAAIGIIHTWACDAAPLDSAAAADMNSATDLGCSTVLSLVRAVQATRGSFRPRLWVVTRGAQAVEGENALSVLQSPLWGYCRSLASEHSELWGGIIDLDPSAACDIAAEAIFAELRSGDGEDQIAYRQGRRYVARLDRCAMVANNDGKTAIRADAAYWVTGGLGGLGLSVAKWLAVAGAQYIMLLGRTALPHRDEWDFCTDPIAKDRICAIREIEAMGSRVYVYSADVADELRLQSILAETTAQGVPRVRGVFHAAGIMQHKAIIETGAEDLAAVGRAKILGSVALHRVLRDEPLELFILFSSASSVLYSPFLSTYAAANAFLDALAHHRRLRGHHAVSVNWGMWSDTGMATAFSSELTSRLAERGMGTISMGQGLDALGTLIRGGPPQVAVLPIDWDKWRAHAPGYANAPMFSRLQGPRQPGRVAMVRRQPASELRRASGHERHVLLMHFVAEMVSEVIGFAAATLNVDEPLTSLGLDSLMALELKNRFENDLAVSVSVVSLLDGPSIRALVLQVEGQLQGREEPVGVPSTPVVLHHKPVDDMSDEEVDAMLAELIVKQGDGVDAAE